MSTFCCSKSYKQYYRVKPLWGPNRFWPGSGLVLRCLGPGFTVLALGPGFRPIFIHSSPEIKIRLGNLLIRPVASFGCQIWGVNFLDLKKGVDSNELEKVHVRFLCHILGVGKNIIIIIIKGHSLRRACLQPATNAKLKT